MKLRQAPEESVYHVAHCGFLQAERIALPPTAQGALAPHHARKPAPATRCHLQKPYRPTVASSRARRAGGPVRRDLTGRMRGVLRAKGKEPAQSKIAEG